jgi:hypothetical protein
MKTYSLITALDDRQSASTLGACHWEATGYQPEETHAEFTIMTMT